MVLLDLLRKMLLKFANIDFEHFLWSRAFIIFGLVLYVLEALVETFESYVLISCEIHEDP